MYPYIKVSVRPIDYRYIEPTVFNVNLNESLFNLREKISDYFCETVNAIKITDL